MIVTAEEENEVDQNATTGSFSTGNNVTDTLDNLDPTFVDYEGWEKMMHVMLLQMFTRSIFDISVRKVGEKEQNES